MKKMLSAAILAACIIFSGVLAFAAEPTEVYFDSYSAGNGNNICVDVKISEDGSPVMLQFCVAYDSSVLDIVSVTTGDAFAGNSAPTINQVDGKIYFIWDSFTPVKDGGTMLHVEFKPKSEEKTEVWIDTSESFVVANSSFEDIGKISGKAEINGSSSSSGSTSSSSGSASSSSGSYSSKDQSKEENKTSSSESSSLENSSAQNSESVSSGNTASNQEGSSSTEGTSENSSITGNNSGLVLDKNQEEVKPGEEIVLNIMEDEENIFWFSSNENVATVENGKVTAHAPGVAIITATTEDGTKEATCVITVVGEEEKETSSIIEVLGGGTQKENGIPGWAIVLIFVMLGAVGAFSVLILDKIRRTKK